MKKLLLTLATAATILPAFGAARQTQYVALDLSNIISNGLVCGNMFAADINNDGYMELMVKGRDLNSGWATTIKALYLDEQNHTTFDKAVDLPDPNGQSWERILYPIDYNNDGNIDLIYASSWGAKLMKGDGKGNFEEVPDFALEGEINIEAGDGKSDKEKWYTGTLVVADFNRDGYNDIVTFCGNPRDDQGTPVVFFNDNGTGKFIKDENTGILPQRGGTLCVGDYNADGAMDILVNGWADDFGNDCTRIWKNDGTGKFTAVVVGDKAGTEVGNCIFVDLTGNGLLDVFITGTSCPNSWENAAYVYKNNGNDTFTKIEAGLSGCQKGSADWCDLNGDGTIDLVYAGEGLNNAVYAFNEGDETFTAVTDKLGKHRGGAVTFVYDINNNNRPDILLMGYQDGENAKHFEIYNGLGSRVDNKAPNAPTNLTATADGNKTVLTWDAGSDEKATMGTGATPADALRYNYFVKTTDGQIITAVPADTETGKLRSANVNAASAARKVTLNIASDKIASWGVQSIDCAKAASSFAVAGTSGIENVLTEADANAPVEYFNIQGVRVANPQNGLYIRRQGNKVDKIYLK